MTSEDAVRLAVPVACFAGDVVPFSTVSMHFAADARFASGHDLRLATDDVCVATDDVCRATEVGLDDTSDVLFGADVGFRRASKGSFDVSVRLLETDDLGVSADVVGVSGQDVLLGVHDVLPSEA